MSQYRTGTVSVTNGSNVVTGHGTAWLANVGKGDWFIVKGDSVDYTVGTVTADGQLTLSVSYQGKTAIGFLYAIGRDFTALYNLPLISDGDLCTGTTYSRGMRLIDARLNQTVKGSPPVQSVTIAAPPAAPTNGQLWIVAANATGAWAGQTNAVAQWDDGWVFLTPEPGNRVWVLDQKLEMLWTGDAWVDSTAGLPQVLAAVAQAEAAETAVAENATAAENAATAASTSATSAGTSATSAKTEADAAAASATAAAGSATTAQTAATAADVSAKAAAASEVVADGSAKVAKTQADAASTAATVADTSAKAAADAATTVAAAVTTVTAASTAATTAAGNAVVSETNAKTSETNAGNSAVTAATSAQAAGASATAAATSQAAGALSATAAASSSASAGTFEGLAHDYAVKAHGTQVEAGTYSAYHWSVEAQQSAAQAAMIAGGNSFGVIGDGTNLRISATMPSAQFNLVQGVGIVLAWSANSVTFGVDAGSIDHTQLKNVGTLTHAQIEAALATVYTKAQASADIAAAISGLVNGAPGALDTIKELADALGDDASFAANLTKTLAGKEPAIAAGVAGQYWDGSKTWKDFPVTYVLPVASATTLGGVKAGTGVAIAADGTLTVTSTGGGVTWYVPTSPGIDKFTPGETDDEFRVVQGMGLYRWSASDTQVADGEIVVGPTTGTGNWILEIASTDMYDAMIEDRLDDVQNQIDDNAASDATSLNNMTSAIQSQIANATMHFAALTYAGATFSTVSVQTAATVSVPGCAVGDRVMLGLPSNWGALSYYVSALGYVSAAGTVTVLLQVTDYASVSVSVPACIINVTTISNH